MKKLLFISDLFPHEINPVYGIFVKHQVDELSKYYQVRVIATYYPNSCKQIESIDLGYPVLRIYFPTIKSIQLSSFPIYRIYALPKIKSLIRSWKPDLIHVHDCRHFPELLILSKLIQRSAIPSYLTLHNIKTLPENSNNPLSRFVYARTLSAAFAGRLSIRHTLKNQPWQHIFTVNDKLKRILDRINCTLWTTTIGNAISNITVNGSQCPENIKKFISNTGFKIISVGNLVHGKGFELLIRAVINLLNTGIDLKLVIVGDGEQHLMLNKIIQVSQKESNILLAGSMNHDVLLNTYQEFDSFILPSYKETFGIVYLEAMAAGLPTIGVKGQGIDGVIIHGENGWLLAPQSVSDIELWIKWLMSNPQEAKAIAHRGQSHVRENYRIDTLCQRIISIYETAR